MNPKPAPTTAIDELQRETWDDDGGAGLTGPRTTSRVPKAPASLNARRVPPDGTPRQPGPGFPSTTPRS
ncbi:MULTISPECIES: hypothetical protein [Methylobacterium]|uniref:Uncharacterized protein n=1 Tax=Methylobacterium bullatum TaxID=570505 RepID=A0AAV4Z2S0_9HYPH|nr:MULTISPECIES: hypothetical protein [Methylobacterium]MBD8902535.1 hypothetical protein [Methylobacterium bullatum]TXN28666.1 hypothetical protein FV220_08170 [Methylobacterium sp. WL19]GJD38082.1 hypothetical protein OICFNHDK_0522 [Methylobacterium bullatum]